MNAAESTPSPDQPAQVPATPAFMRRICESVIGLLSGAVLGGIGGAVAFALVGSGLVLSTSGEFSTFITVIWGIAGAVVGATCGGLYGMLHGAFVGAIWSLFGGPKAYGPKSAGIKWCIRVVLFGSVIALASYIWSDQAANPPDPSEIQSMTVDFYKPKGERVNFSVPAEHIAKVLTALTPAQRDWNPAKWIHWGRLRINGKNDRTTTVDLYTTHGAIGAFSVHPDDRIRNAGFVSNYFRGGTDMAILEAIQNAYASSKLE